MESLRGYHKINPPMHILVARYLGVGGEAAAAGPMTEAELDEVMAMFPEAPRSPV